MSEPPPAAARFRVPAAPASAETREKGSRFLAVVGPAGGEDRRADLERALAGLRIAVTAVTPVTPSSL